MEQLVTRICNLLCIKSIVTLALTATFVFLCVNGAVSADMFLTIFTVVIGFYFGTQAVKKDDAAADKVVAETATTTEEVKT